MHPCASGNGLNCPGWHLLHVVDPLSSVYVPIGHSSHSPFVFVNDPGEHFPASDPSVEFAGKTVSALFSSTGHAVP